MKVLITTSKHIASFQLASLLKNDEVLFGDHFKDFPVTDNNSIAHEILKFCLDHQITKVFPLTFAEVTELRKSMILFDEFGIEIMLNAEETEVLNEANKTVSSFMELSTSLIGLGYPNTRVAVANADGRGELILIDDAVKNNLQIWNQVKTINFNQLGKWFNQSNFQTVALYPVVEDFRQFYILIENEAFQLVNRLDDAVYGTVKESIQSTKNLKGFYHVALLDQSVLRIVNTSF